MITGLNHITLAVSDLNRSLDSYIRLLGFKGHVKWDGGAYLSAGELWLCLSIDSPSHATDYTHIAFNVAASDFQSLKNKLLNDEVKTWKESKSEGNSVYLLDPDGHKLEIHVGSLQSRLASLKEKPYRGLEWL